MTSIGPSFGARIRHWRKLRRMSQTALGEQVGLTGAWVSAVERGERSAGADRLSVLVPLLLALRTDLRTFLTAPVAGCPPFPLDWLARVDEAFGFGGTHAGIAPIARTLVEAGPDVLVLAKDPQGGLHLMQRRDALKRGFAVAGVVGSAALPLHPEQQAAVANASEAGSPNADAILAFRGILDALRRAEDRLGSTSDLLRAAQIHHGTLKGWLGTTGGAGSTSMTTDVARLAAEYASSCGWMAYDQGHRRAALDLYQDALGHAKLLGDRPLAALLSARIARINGESASHRTALDMADRAVSLLDGTGAWRVAVVAHGEHAGILARLGDTEGMVAALGRAEEALSATGGADTPYAYFVNPATVALYRGYCHADLGQHDVARETLAANPATAPLSRDRARSLTRLAESDAMARDVASACRTAGEVVDLLRTVSSGWVARRLRRLHGQLLMAARGGEVARVRELGDRLRGVA